MSDTSDLNVYEAMEADPAYAEEINNWVDELAALHQDQQDETE